METKSGIYEIVNRANGKRYIGSAVRFEKRWKEHRRELRRGVHHSSYLQRAWDKYGAEVFRFRVILVCSRENLALYEQRCFDGFKPEYNMARDVLRPMLGRSHTEEARLKIGRAASARPKTEAERAKISAVLTGVSHSLARVEKNRRGHIGKYHTEQARAWMSVAFQGRRYSAEAIAKSAAMRTGAKRSLEARERMRLAHLGEKHSPARRAKAAARMRGNQLTLGYRHTPEARVKIAAASRAAAERRRAAKNLRVVLGVPNPID